MAKPRAQKTKRKVKKNVPEGVVSIRSTFNNTLVTFADKEGNVISWSSSGCHGFKGSRKSTPFAAQIAVEDAAKRAMDQGMRKVVVNVTGPGPGRDAAIRAVQVAGLDVSVISDVTSVPHNG